MQEFKDQSKSLNINEKKFTRLISRNNLDQHDEFLINYYYEEKQNWNYFYTFSFNLIFSGSWTFFLFRQNSKYLQFALFSTCFYTLYNIFKKRIDFKFNSAVEPFYEKYKVK